CLVCPTSSNGKTLCDGQQCVLACDATHHLCQDSCKANDDPTACGPGCDICPVPQGGRAICANGSCDFQCPDGQPCQGQCIPSGQRCDKTCPAGQRACSAGCVTGDCCADN